MNDMTPYAELPEYWQREICRLRSRAASLRRGLITPDDLSSEARRTIRQLTRGAAKLRIQRNEARAEADRLRAELAARNG